MTVIVLMFVGMIMVVFMLMLVIAFHRASFL
jgi:hypothetical protein